MPLDGHAYLVNQGWSGKGSGLRHGAISRPLAVTQKKTLSGIGKDRDEAFPFWDHVFKAAAINIQVKVQKDSDDESDNEAPATPQVVLQRTSTGIISHRRPVTGTPAHSGTATPNLESSSGSSTPRLGILAMAKQEAARRLLYSRFYRGPVINDEPNAVQDTQPQQNVDSTQLEDAECSDSTKSSEQSNEKEERRRKREEKRRRREEKAKDGSEVEDAVNAQEIGLSTSTKDRREEKADRRRRKEEKRARKAEKRRRREEKERRELQEEDSGNGVEGCESVLNSDSPEDKKSKRKRKAAHEDSAPDTIAPEKVKKKRRKTSS